MSWNFLQPRKYAYVGRTHKTHRIFLRNFKLYDEEINHAHQVHLGDVTNLHKFGCKNLKTLKIDYFQIAAVTA